MKTTGCPRETSVAVPREPNLSDVLNDPVVIAVMRADDVRLDELARVRVCRVSSHSGRPRQGEET